MQDNNNRYGKGYFDENDHKRGIVLNRGLTGVFALMFLGLLSTAAVALFVATSPAAMRFVFGSNISFWIFLLAPLALVMFAFPRVWNMTSSAAFLLFFAYALLNGVTFAAIFFMYDLGTIALAFFSAAGMFAAMAVYGAVTKADLSGIGSFLFMGLIGIIIASILNWFFANDTLDILISYAGVAIFLGLTAYHVQNIKQMMAQSDGKAPAGVMVMGALHLYLAFINLFFFILRILGRRR